MRRERELGVGGKVLNEAFIKREVKFAFVSLNGSGGFIWILFLWKSGSAEILSGNESDERIDGWERQKYQVSFVSRKMKEPQ